VDEDVSLQKFYTTCDGFDNVLGSVGSVKITENDTRFFGPNEKYKNIRLERLNNEIIPALSLAKEENSFMFEKDNEIGTLSKRLSNLSDSGNASIIVGGKTSEEKKTKEFLIVDAISAVKSALKHGVVLGNNVTIPSALYSAFNNIEIEDEFIERVITEIVESYYSAFLHVVINVRPGAEVRDIFDECRSKYQTFNVRTGKMEKLSDLRGDDLGKTLLVNSVEADIEIFKTAVSIAILLAFSDNFLSSKGFHSERMIEMLPPM
jgi:chaperonin GroEL (HSP60 family)